MVEVENLAEIFRECCRNVRITVGDVGDEIDEIAKGYDSCICS